MAEPLPPNGGDADDLEPQELNNKSSAEDRKAAAALSKLDDNRDDNNNNGGGVNQEAFSRAMDSLGAAEKKKEQVAPAKKVKVDAADVALVVEELELSKAKATDLLKAHDGNAVKAIRAYIAPVF